MKCFFPLLFFLLLLGSTLSAQTERGTILIGGTPGFGLSRNAQTLYLDPQVGYFVLDHWVIGTQLDIRISRQRLPIVHFFENDWEFSIQADPFLFSRYYFSPQKKWRPFLHAEVGLLGQNTISSALGGGMAFFASDHLSLDMALMLGALADGNELLFQARGIEFGLNFFLNTRKQE